MFQAYSMLINIYFFHKKKKNLYKSLPLGVMAPLNSLNASLIEVISYLGVFGTATTFMIFLQWHRYFITTYSILTITHTLIIIAFFFSLAIDYSSNYVMFILDNIN